MKRIVLTTWSMVLVLGFILTVYAKEEPLSPEKFYSGKTIKFWVGYGAGGGFDTTARLLAPYLGKYTGATVIVENMAGGGGSGAVNNLYLSAKPDGLTIVLAAGRLALSQLLKEDFVKFDFSKFKFIGRMGTERGVVLASGKSAYAKMSPSDLINALKINKFKYAAQTKDDTTTLNFALLSHAVGLKPKMVLGYKGTAEAALAVVRGECDIICTSDSTAVTYSGGRDLVPKLAISTERIKQLPDVPAITELTKLSEEGKWCIDKGVSLYRPLRIIIAPPAVPKDRVDFLISAVNKSVLDEKFIAQSQKMNMSVDYAPPEECIADINQILGMNEAETKKLKYIILEEFY